MLYSYFTKRSDKMRIKPAIMVIALTAFVTLSGCAAITVPTPEDVMKTPLGTESVKIGMTKQQVESIWGKPDSAEETGSDLARELISLGAGRLIKEAEGC